MRLRFRILDAAVSLTGPEKIVDLIGSAYARFVVPSVPADDATGDRSQETLDIGVAAEGIRIGHRLGPWVDGLEPAVQVYQQFLAAVMDRIGAHAVLHAAALVNRRGGAFLLGAPSGHGKSSLTLGLLERGYRFLSDDYAPLDLERRRIMPYPRAVAVDLEGQAPIPAIWRSAAEEGRSFFGKRLIDVGRLLGEQAIHTESAPLQQVILLSGKPGAEGGDETLLDVAARMRSAERLDLAFSTVVGLDILQRRDLSELRMWRLRLRADGHPTLGLSHLLDDEDIVFCEKHWSGSPRFESDPDQRPIRRRTAAELLGRELLNRRGGSRLLSRYDGSVPRLFIDLAGALRDADCRSVTTGQYEATLNLIEDLVS